MVKKLKLISKSKPSVPEAWKRAVLRQMECGEEDMVAKLVTQAVDEFFSEQNLTLPPGKSWRNVSANVFGVVDGKRIWFENGDSLFHQLRKGAPSIELIREEIAMTMTADEIHEDVHQFMDKLVELTK